MDNVRPHYKVAFLTSSQSPEDEIDFKRCKNFASAVISRALDDLGVMENESLFICSNKERQQALRWILSRSEKKLSLIYWCHWLSSDPRDLAHSIRDYLYQNAAKIERLMYYDKEREPGIEAFFEYSRNKYPDLYYGNKSTTESASAVIEPKNVANIINTSAKARV